MPSVSLPTRGAAHGPPGQGPWSGDTAQAGAALDPVRAEWVRRPRCGGDPFGSQSSRPRLPAPSSTTRLTSLRMFHSSLAHSLWFIVLVIVQALVFNHIHLWGYATPMPYVFVLLILRHGTPRWLYVVVGFVTGLCVDAVSTTPGVAAGSLTLTGLCTPGVLHFFAPDEKLEEAFLPGARTMTWSGFLKFAATLSFVTVAGFHLLESFTFFRLGALLLNIGGSFVLTLAFVATFERVRVAFSSAETAAR